MVRQTARVLFLEIFGALLLLLLIAAAVIVLRLAAGPIELTPFRDDIERALAGARGGQPVEIDRVLLEWSPDERRVKVTAENVRLLNKDGDLGARASRAEIELDASALIMGRARVNELLLDDGQVRVVHMGGDIWQVAGKEVTISIPRAAALDMRAIVDRINAFSESLFRSIAPDETDLSLRRLRITGFSVEIFDAAGVRVAEIPALSGQFARDVDDSMALSVEALSPGAGLPERLAISLTANPARDILDLQVDLSDWSLEALVVRLAGQEVTAPTDEGNGLPLSGTLSLRARQGQGIERLGWDLALRKGVVMFAGSSVAIDAANVKGQLDVADERLLVELRRLDAGPVSGDFNVVVQNVFDTLGTGPLPFEMTSPAMTLDLTPDFEAPVTLGEVLLRGTLDAAASTMAFERLQFRRGEMTGRAQGRFQWGGLDKKGLRPGYALEASLEVDGAVSKADVLAFWPTTLAPRARADVSRDFEAGRISDVTMRFDLYPGRLVDEALNDEAMTIRFQFDDARYRFLPDMPPIEEASGVARLGGNSLDITLTRGRIASWDVRSGEVGISRFKPQGGTLTVTAQASGPITDALGVLQDSRIALGREEGFDVGRVSGLADASIVLQRPLGEDVPLGTFDYTVTGSFRDAGLSGIAPGVDLSAASGDLYVDPASLRLNGRGRSIGSAMTFSARHDFASASPTPTRVEASGVVTPDVLNRFGFLVRAYLSGEVPVDVVMLGDGGRTDRIDFDFDLSDARIEVTEIGLRKPMGAEASASVVFRAPTSVRPSAYSASFSSRTAEFDGDIRMTTDGRVDVITLRRAYVASRLDVSGQIARDPVDGVRVLLEGPYLDASGLFGGLSLTGAGTETLTGNLSMLAKVERLKLDDVLDVRDAEFQAVIRDGRVSALVATGNTAPGQAFAARLAERADGQREFSLGADDAGFVFSALFNVDFVTGGRMTLDGVLERGDNPTQFTLNLYEARLMRAPLLTQVLSLASLRGLADTLSGEGVLFTRVEIPVTMMGERFIIRGGRASGPALGLTIKGSLELGAEGMIDVDGVLVPSFGINSALGGIPIIGDLFVSREGEGVFSLTYSVEGTLEKAQVAINPLSAVTPGVLRRIFEDPENSDLSQLPASQPDAALLLPQDFIPLPPPEAPVDDSGG